MIEGTSWLVTGGTGSFGHAFICRLLDEGARRVVVLSRDELKQAEMARAFHDDRLRFFIGSVVQRERVRLAMAGVDYVVHAAAMKRIDTCELNPHEAVDTNILGTLAVAHACITAGVKRAVFLSTDKAAAPNTHYGACKLAAERLWIQSNVYAAGMTTRLAATRYGNVIGSRGSVVPLFKAQAETGTITMTDPASTRFWMTLAQAVGLVLLAFENMRGGEVFIPKVPSTSVANVAHAVAHDVTWETIGLRPGEKLHETLISEDEARATREYPDHYRIEPNRTWDEASTSLGGEVLPLGFSYSSDKNPWQINAEQMRDLISGTAKVLHEPCEACG